MKKQTPLSRKIKKILTGRTFGLTLFLLVVISVLLLWLHKDSLPASSKYGYFGVFLANLLASSTVIIPLPGVAAVFLGGGLWDPVLVGIAAGFGATLGELTGYLAGYCGRNVIHTFDKKNWFIHMETFFRKNGFITIIVTSFLPFPLFDAIGMFAGVLHYPFWKFFLAVLMGRVIRDIIIAWSGARILPY